MTTRSITKWILLASAAAIGAVIAIAAMNWNDSRIARLAADDALARAVHFVGQEVDYIAGDTEAERHFYALLAASSYVQANLSSARYGRAAVAGADLAGLSSGQCLAQGVGICGDQAMTVFYILDGLDVPARVVALYYLSDGGTRAAHVVVEVEWAGDWHMMDATWGFLPIGEAGPFDVLSVEELLAGAPYSGYSDDLHPWTFQYRQAGLDPLDYLRADVDVVASGTGTIRPALAGDDASSYALNDIPVYIGHGFSSDGRLGEMRYDLALPPSATTLTIKASHWNCDGGGALIVNDQRHEFDREIIVPGMSGQAVLRVESNSETEHCYLSLSALEIG